MFRYLALLWDSSQAFPVCGCALTADLLCHRKNWACVMRTEGLAILVSGGDRGTAEAQILRQNRGLVLGCVFGHNDHARGPTILSAADGDAILATAGRVLTRRYWGRYVAILRDPDGSCIRVLRDPSGGLLCFVTRLDSLTLVFSHLQDICLLNEFQPSINWDYLRAHTLLAPLHTAETALREVSEVQAGECLEIRPGGQSRITYWNAMNLARSEPIEDVQAAVEIVGATTRTCVRRWGSCHTDVVLNLSGLDSNIVLRCLTRDRNGPRITCLNFFSDGPEEDEREVARAGSQAAGCELIEYRRQPQAVPLEGLLSLRPSAKPAFYLYVLQYAGLETAVARQAGASALFTGYGGDELFLQSGARMAAMDYVLTQGLGRNLWHIARDASRVDRVSVWQILAGMLSVSLFHRKPALFPDIDIEQTLVTPQVMEVLRDAERFAPSCLRDAHEVPEGKRRHALWMSRLPAMELPIGPPDTVDRVAPLMSQPLIEACLRIPTWVMISGGWDRAIARQAFANELPRQIVRRRAKGGSTDTVHKIFEHQMPFIRELMLEGELVRAGILDRRKVEACFREDAAGSGCGRTELLVQHASTEAWLRSWRNRRTPHQVFRRINETKRPSTSAFSRS